MQMTNYAGYMGKVIRLDLGSRSVSEYPWTDRDRQLYLGGKAMASKIMYDNFTGSEKPLEPENIIVISTGPLTGTGAPSSSRFNISTLSPQTGITTSSNCGGNFGHYLKKAGYDALIIAGKPSTSQRPMRRSTSSGIFWIMPWVFPQSMNGCIWQNRRTPVCGTMPRPIAGNFLPIASSTGSHTAAMKNAWKPFGMPRRRLGPT